MKPDLNEVLGRVKAATGADRELDRLITAAVEPVSIGLQQKAYTSSVDDCLRLIAILLPDWHWHVGHGPDGILPYAALSKSTGSGAQNDGGRVEVAAPTVPLALLGAALQALMADRARE